MKHQCSGAFDGGITIASGKGSFHCRPRHLCTDLEDEDMQSFGLQLSASLSKAVFSTGFGHSEG